MTTTLVTGTITLPADAANFKGATVYLNLEHAGMMGMPAELAAQSIMHNVDYEGGSIAFTVAGQDVGEGGKYNLRVHISMDGSEDFAKGDYVTKRTNTVLSNGAPDEGVEVIVEAV